ncbi:MAG: SDR family oxidoreductase [Nanoarchaeota archaeon]
MVANRSDDVFDVSGRVVIITGAAGVLGSHFSRVLSARGANVVVADLSQGACDAIVEELTKEHGTDPLAIAMDLADERSVESMVKNVMAKYRRIDVLINNAATKSKHFFAPLEEFPLDEWRAVMDVNVTGMFLTAKHILPHMVKAKKGNIVNIASIYGVVAPQKELYGGLGISSPAVYSVSKGGVVMLTKYLAAMYADKGIRVNTMTPGGVSDHQLGGNEFQKRYAARVPMGRMATKEDLSGPLLFLASDASSYITGQNIIVDGGWTSR